ncbi:MAG: type IV toxin-antitoxin system AbiEi family antitoxin domain-containing protein [Elusimicrobia bacterium]|nr:type IV toxin-antitoxin system AbiEi family antitoxin domain-containing protein [Elusimicrobiota bacterium]
MTKNVAENTLARIVRLGKGAVFTPKDFLDLASHETVRQTLWRLAKEGKIRRLLRGVYEYPMFSKMMNAPAAPAPDAIAHAIAHTHGWTIVPTGPTALNRLGLSTQVPAHWQYLSDGPSKNYTWAGGTLVLKHRTNKETATLSPKTALLVQALKSLGTDNIDASTVATLRSKFNSKERARALKEARYVTSWVYEIIKQLALKDTPHA